MRLMRQAAALAATCLLAACTTTATPPDVNTPSSVYSPTHPFPTPPSSSSVPGAGEPAGVLPLPVTLATFIRPPVCTGGTGQFRPSTTYTNEVKRVELSTPVGQTGYVTDPRSGTRLAVPGYKGYAGLGPADAGNVELDHYGTLAWGGDGYDPAGLWPEPHNATGYDGKPAGSTVKDALEAYGYRQLCAGKLTQATVESWVRPGGDWYRVYVALGRP